MTMPKREELKEMKPIRENGFYWVRTSGRGWCVAEYIHDDRFNEPWNFTGTDNTASEDFLEEVNENRLPPPHS